MEAWVAVDKDGSEYSFEMKPYRDYDEWRPVWDDGFEEYTNYMGLPKGSIKKLIGRELTWEDDPVELKPQQS